MEWPILAASVRSFAAGAAMRPPQRRTEAWVARAAHAANEQALWLFAAHATATGEKIFEETKCLF